MINFFNLKKSRFKYYFNNPSEIVLINLFKYIYIKSNSFSKSNIFRFFIILKFTVWSKNIG